MNTDELNAAIRKAGWFDGDQAEWDALPYAAKLDMAFAATGCEVAYPTWAKPVNCWHTTCQIRRGELPAIVETNRVLRNEMENGWLRFHKDSQTGRDRLARLCMAIRKEAGKQGIYNPWKLAGGWQAMVYEAVM